MVKSLQALIWRLLPLLIIQSLLPSFVQGQSNGTFVNQSAFTHFELFKNTGLHPCPINITVPTVGGRGVEVVPRSPRKGGGGGHSGGGTYAEGLVKQDWVGDQAKYCNHMTAIPIMIPATPTQYAFTPWWPTFMLQFVSLAVTFTGLWFTARSVEKKGQDDMKLPHFFWIQLPFDMARIIAWFVKTFYGFAKPKRFSWISVILWLVPFNYIWLVQLIGAKKPASPTVDWQAVTQIDGYGRPVDNTKVRIQGPHVEEAYSPTTAAGLFLRGKLRLPRISIGIALLTVFMWLISLTVVILHFKYSWFDKKSHPTYVEAAKALSDPSSIATGMPQACLSWLQGSTSIVAYELLDLRTVQVVQVLIVTAQFVICTIIVIFKKDRRHHILGKLKLSAYALLSALVLPAIGTGFWILGTVVLGNQDAWMSYTNNRNTTGGCTFGAVAMGRQWGYWDVQYERPYRIAMSLLGVS